MPPFDAEGPIQGELDFESGNTDGFENWERQQEQLLETIRWEWSLPVGRTARIRLRSIPGELVGRLLLAEKPASIDRQLTLKLRIGRVEFTHTEIEDWLLEEEN